MYPTSIPLMKQPILSQQITVDFQLSQKAWNQLSNQMNKMVKANTLLKKHYRVHIKIDKHAETESQKSFKCKENFNKTRKSD